MIKDMVCPVCDADIPMDGDEKPGDLILCSYCKVTFKLLKRKDKWVLVEDFEEQLPFLLMSLKIEMAKL